MTSPDPTTTPFPEDPQQMLKWLREQGWTLALHRDQSQAETPGVLWLFTQNGIALRGEGQDDATAILKVFRQALEIDAKGFLGSKRWLLELTAIRSKIVEDLHTELQDATNEREACRHRLEMLQQRVTDALRLLDVGVKPGEEPLGLLAAVAKRMDDLRRAHNALITNPPETTSLNPEERRAAYGLGAEVTRQAAKAYLAATDEAIAHGKGPEETLQGFIRRTCVLNEGRRMVIEEAQENLKGILESLSLILGPESRLHSLIQDIIRGYLASEPARARAILEKIRVLDVAVVSPIMGDSAKD